MSIRSKAREGFTLVEIVVVLIIMGMLSVMVVPAFKDSIDISKYNLNKSQMQMIKRATLDFYNDVGFAPDNVSLLIYPFEECEVKANNFDDVDTSEICKNMISFVDKHYKKYDSSDEGSKKIREDAEGDNGGGTLRKEELINIISTKLNPKKGGWRGGYIGGNGFLKVNNIKKLGGYTEATNLYFFSDKDVDRYYDGFASSVELHTVDSSWSVAKANKELYPIYTATFGGAMDLLYENAGYRKEESGTQSSTFAGAMTILDPWGTPYEIQIPTVGATSGKVRTKYVRIVSFGKNGRRDTPINELDIDYKSEGYDDSVLYIFDANQSYFHPED